MLRDAGGGDRCGAGCRGRTGVALGWRCACGWCRLGQRSLRASRLVQRCLVQSRLVQRRRSGSGLSRCDLSRCSHGSRGKGSGLRRTERAQRLAQCEISRRGGSGVPAGDARRRLGGCGNRSRGCWRGYRRSERRRSSGGSGDRPAHRSSGDGDGRRHDRRSGLRESRGEGGLRCGSRFSGCELRRGERPWRELRFRLGKGSGGVGACLRLGGCRRIRRGR